MMILIKTQRELLAVFFNVVRVAVEFSETLNVFAWRWVFFAFSVAF